MTSRSDNLLNKHKDGGTLPVHNMKIKFIYFRKIILFRKTIEKPKKVWDCHKAIQMSRGLLTTNSMEGAVDSFHGIEGLTLSRASG